MIYSSEVQRMCPVAKGAYHGPAPIPEEGKWVQAKEIKDIMFETFKLAIDDELSPRMDLHKEPELLGTMMFSNQSIDSLSDAKPDVNHPMSENPRVQQIAKKERFAFDKDGKPFSKMKQFQLRDGIFEAIIDRFYKDASLIAYGEENRDWGGAFAVYRGLTEALPYHRLFNAPIAEAAIIGTAIGALGIVCIVCAAGVAGAVGTGLLS